jgi:hypothetical protein
MKKLFLSVVFILTLCMGVNAQLISLGVKGGMNFSTLTRSKTIPVQTSSGSSILLGEGNPSYRRGFNVGGFVAIKVPFIGIQAEVLYSRQGVINEGSVASGLGNYKTTVTLNYVSIPLLLQFYIIPKTLNFEIGPQFSFLSNAKQVTDFASLSSSGETIDLNNINDTDVGLAIGAGLKIPKLPLGINARYILGFKETFSNHPDNKKLRNGVFQVSIFLKFKLV